MANLTRYYMYKEIEKALKKPMKGRILGISGINRFRHMIDLQKSKIVDVKYPKIDMQKLPYKTGSFDYVISDQVIEHLADPFLAISESRRVLKKNGIAIHTTCFINPIHFGPSDYWRFSSDALKILCKPFSKIVQTGSWGNWPSVLICLIGKKLRFAEVPETRFSTFNMLASFNQSKFPIVTWIIAKK